ncbi:MAG: hypothetical protein HKO98_11645 [Gemmatimonadetes bacterium]|nr:hypothetical protein [Gemmatimonadota bacterium]
MRWSASAAALATLLAALAAPPQAAGAQQWDELVVTAGISGESYDGNLASVTVPVVDSANAVGAAVGEFGLRGSGWILNREKTSLFGSFDLGMRQFLASGFEIRDYSPRERSGRASLQLLQRLGDVGLLRITGDGWRRSIDDRPPMPLFLQPGYTRFAGLTQVTFREIDGVVFDVALDAEVADYEAPEGVGQINLLDRESQGFEIGASWGRDWQVRFFGSYRRLEYPEQSSFDPSDPYRRDRTLTVGGEWRYASSVFQAELGVEGIVNRSNSRRPEYDAFSVRSLMGVPLPWWGLGVNLYAVVTGKSYLSLTPFARLVPGEEADNASIVYLDVNREVAPNLDASVRFGFTRGETDIGDAYYQRYGMSFFLNYRPWVR